MCNPMFLMAGASAIKGIGDYSSAIQGAKAMNANAAELDRAAADTNQRGAAAAASVLQRGQEVKGTQSVAMAANGLDFSQGTGADVLAKTAADTQFDAMTVQNNAMREAYGLNVRAIQQRYQAKATKRQAAIGLAGSLLGSGAQAWGGFSGMGGQKLSTPNARMMDGGVSQANNFRGYA